METISVNGRDVHISWSPGADLVVMVRLASRDGGIWDNLWTALEGRYTLANVVLEQPGDTAAESPAAVLRQFADIIVATARELDDKSFHLIGWTGGTQIGLQAAVHHANRLASLTLITPFREVVDRRAHDRGLDIIEAILRSGDRELYTYFWFMAGLSDAFIRNRFDEVDRLAQQRLASDPFVSLDVDRAMTWMRGLRRDWIDDDTLATLDLPVLILGAGENRWHAGPSQDMAEALQCSIPRSELHIMAGLGPLMLLEAPDRVANTVRPFLEAHPAS